MKGKSWLKTVMVLAVMGIAAHYTVAQDVAAPYDDEVQARFEFTPHSFSANGSDWEIFVKIDYFTGQTWRFHGSDPKWTPIAEQEEGAPEPDKRYRYEMLVHNYILNGQPTELVLRVDVVTGMTWVYNGTYEGWRRVDAPVAAQ